MSLGSLCLRSHGPVVLCRPSFGPSGRSGEVGEALNSCRSTLPLPVGSPRLGWCYSNQLPVRFWIKPLRIQTRKWNPTTCWSNFHKRENPWQREQKRTGFTKQPLDLTVVL